MPKMVKLPVIGEVKRGYAIAGAASVFVIVGYAYLRRRNSASASSAMPATDTSAATVPSTDTSTIDPATGFPYGSAEDQQALAAIDGSAYGGYGSGFGTGGGFYQPPVTTVTTPVSTSSGTTIKTNAEWLQHAVNHGLAGVSAEQMELACALWFAGAKVSASQLSVIRQMEAVFGPPPHHLPPPKLQNRGGSTGSHNPVKYGSFTANGQASLETAASIRHNTVHEVIDATDKHHPGDLVHDYLARGNYHDKLPRGSKWYFVEKK